MKLKLLVAFTLIAAGLTGVGGTAWADGTASTWSQLVAEVQAGGRVTLGANITNPVGVNLRVTPGTPVTLDLHGKTLVIGSLLDDTAGIEVGPGASLTIDDTTGGGSLTATGGDHGAGIGGSGSEAGGAISIMGGSVHATGGILSAGIGGSSHNVSPTIGCYQGPTVESVTVSGGQVTAQGGQNAAGIGASCAGQGGAISITGGEVSATGAAGGAGIGGGRAGWPAPGSTNMSVTVSAGVVTAQGSNGAAGVGGGSVGAAADLTVHGGSVNATGGPGGPGIGQGNRGSSECAYPGSLTVTGGAVSGVGSAMNSGGVFGGAGIGGGSGCPGGAVTVSGGTVIGTGAFEAAGVGGGYGGNGAPVTVSGGSVTATGGSGGAGVGGGYVRPGGSVTIEAGGSLTATGGGTAGAIGPGADTAGASAQFGSLSNAGTLTFPSAATETVPSGATITNTGTINLDGTLNLVGTLSGAGTIHNHGRILGTVPGGGVGPAGTAAFVDVHNYNLSFNLNGGSGSTPAGFRVFAGTLTAAGRSLPPNPTKPGYTFTGWYTAAAGGSQVQNTTDLRTALGVDGPLSATLYAHFTSNPQPAVTDVSPDSGPAAGNTNVVITGSGFTDATKVEFNTVTAKSYRVVSDTRIEAVTPSRPAGIVHVYVTTPVGKSAPIAADRFTFTPPQVTGVTPNFGPLSGGGSVTISGFGLVAVTQVSFGGVAATDFTVQSSRSMTVRVPARATGGTVDVRVTGYGGTSDVAPGDKYNYRGPPTVAGVSPDSGPTSGGTTVVLTGTGFTGASAVTFNGTAAHSFTVNSDTKISAVAPSRGASTVHVYVTNSSGTSAAVLADRYTFKLPPTVTGVSPKTGPRTGGTTVVLTGTGFTNASAVAFNGTPAPTYTVNSDTKITVTTPARTPGPVHIYVTAPGGKSPPVDADTYAFI